MKSLMTLLHSMTGPKAAKPLPLELAFRCAESLARIALPPNLR